MQLTDQTILIMWLVAIGGVVVLAIALLVALYRVEKDLMGFIRNEAARAERVELLLKQQAEDLKKYRDLSDIRHRRALVMNNRRRKTDLHIENSMKQPKLPNNCIPATTMD